MSAGRRRGRLVRRIALGLAAGAAAGALALAVAGWLAWTRGEGPADGAADTTAVLLRVPAGAGLAEVSDLLVTEGLLKRPRVFALGARLSGADRRLRAGRYVLPRGLSPRDLLRRLVEGRTEPVVVTVPEGADAVAVADILGRDLGLEPGRFLAVADSLVRAELAGRGWIGGEAGLAAYGRALDRGNRDFDRGFHWSEGYLFPETYHFEEGTGAAAAAAVLVGAALDTLEAMLAADGDAAAPALAPHGLVTLASLVEAEARLDAERPRIAAVYRNRLRLGRALEADPCVAYVLGKRGERLLYADLEVDSPWNTYRESGLPPGPIGNPGAAALRAALHPEPDCDALYFVADGNGGHVFSRTWEEHRRAVRDYRRARDARP